MSATGGFNHEDKSRFPAAFAVGLVFVALIVLAVVLVTRSAHPTQPGHEREQSLPFDAAAQSYAPSIHFQSLQLSEASNLIAQKFTYVNGIVANNGSRGIKALEVKVEFHDPFNQVILRDTNRLIRESDNPLAAGKQRAFNLTLDGVPAEWNQQNPTIQVIGLVLQ